VEASMPASFSTLLLRWGVRGHVIMILDRQATTHGEREGDRAFADTTLAEATIPASYHLLRWGG
ncbi:hypothetical protein A2U01_0095945, partial [Trifolium medium]|nr:hypothetical protein [Trifolium medium]